MNMTIKILSTLIALVFVTGNAFSEDAESVMGEVGLWGLAVASVTEQITLVSREKTIIVCDEGDCIDRVSDLRISAVVLDSGPSTDATERYGLYLIMHNSVQEHAVAKSVHLIASMEELKSAKRVEAGIYEFVFNSPNYGYLETKDPNCRFVEMRARVDARVLSAEVRKAERTSFFEDATYTDPIYVTRSTIGCV